MANNKLKKENELLKRLAYQLERLAELQSPPSLKEQELGETLEDWTTNLSETKEAIKDIRNDLKKLKKVV